MAQNTFDFSYFWGKLSTILAGKQATLTTAQQNAVDSGITSAKVAQYDKDSAATAELVDSVAKNIVDFQTPTASNRTTIVKNSDGGVTFSCSNASWANASYNFSATPGKEYEFSIFVDSVDAGNVQFQCFINESDSESGEYSEIARTARILTTGVATVSFTPTKPYIKASINLNNSGTSASGSATFRSMICTAADWAVSQKFVPYCPSMAELYAMIKALQAGT